MALVAWTRLRLLWGAFDFETDNESPSYHVGNTIVTADEQILGRRAVLEWTRTGTLADDKVQTSLVLANITDGDLDDTWTDTDYDNCEDNILDWWNVWKPNVHSDYMLAQIKWYRVGPGATPPEPATRTLTVGSSGTAAGGSAALPPQISPNVSLRTVLRKRWGRIYLPAWTESHNSTIGQIENTPLTALINATQAMNVAFAADDFVWGVYSPTMQRIYAIERLVADSIWDVQRSRRAKVAAYYYTRP